MFNRSKRKDTGSSGGAMSNKKVKLFDKYQNSSKADEFTQEESKHIRAFVGHLFTLHGIGDLMEIGQNSELDNNEKVKQVVGLENKTNTTDIVIKKVTQFVVFEKNETIKSDGYFCRLMLVNVPYVNYTSWMKTETFQGVIYSWDEASSNGGCNIGFIISFQENFKKMIKVDTTNLVIDNNCLSTDMEKDTAFADINGFERDFFRLFVESMGKIEGVFTDYSYEIEDAVYSDVHFKKFEKYVTENIGSEGLDMPCGLLKKAIELYAVKYGNNTQTATDMILTIPFYRTFRNIVAPNTLFLKISGVPNFSLNLLRSLCSAYDSYIYDIIIVSKSYSEQKELDYQILIALNKDKTRSRSQSSKDTITENVHQF